MAKKRWFAKRLQELREAAGLSREDLAKRAGLRSKNGIRDLEQDKRNPSWAMVIRLADALGVDCRAFVALNSERPRKKPPKKRGDDADK